jgi:LysR family transcriptional regulator, regulator for genes of the gallate degradation pathway
MSIDQKRLTDLLSIVRHGSFGRAAAARRISQPALSASITVLEKAAGGPVLVRSRQGVTLTPLGRILFEHARALETLLSRAATEAKLSTASFDGPLVIGASPIAAASIVPKAVLRLRTESSRSPVSIVEGVDDDLMSRLRIGELDLVVAPLGSDHAFDDIEEKPLLRGPMTVIMRPENPAARHRTLRYRQLVSAQWVLPNPGSALRRRLDALFLLAGVAPPAQSIASNSIAAVKAIVRQSDCVAIMARAMAEPELVSGQLVAIPIADGAFIQTLGIKRWRHHAVSPLAKRFSDILGTIAQEMGQKRRSGQRAKPKPRARPARAAHGISAV